MTVGLRTSPHAAAPNSSVGFDALLPVLNRLGGGSVIRGVLSVERLAGPWGLAFPAEGWPAFLPPLRLPRGNFHDSRGYRLPDWLVWIIDRIWRKTVPVEPPAFDRDFARANGLHLAACHAALGCEIAARLTSLFTPLWAEVPFHLTAVSGKAVAWRACVLSLAAETLNNVQRFAVAHDASGGSFNGLRLTETDELSDYISVHLSVELAVEMASLALGLATGGGADSEADRPQRGLKLVHPMLQAAVERSSATESRFVPGGLRRGAFLATYHDLVDAADRKSAAAARWLKAVDMLIARSPLTRLVYADVAPSVSTGEAAFVALTAPPGSNIESWWEVWMSHLARSMVGAVCSLPTGIGQLADTERKCAALERQIQTGGRKLGQVFRLAALKDHFAALWRGAHLRILQRLQLLCDVFGTTKGPAGRAFLQMRFLDMLVRHVNSLAAGALVAAIPAVSERFPHNRSMMRKEVLLSLQSPLFNCFARVLFGQSWAEARPMLLAMEIAKIEQEREKERTSRTPAARTAPTAPRDSAEALRRESLSRVKACLSCLIEPKGSQAVFTAGGVPQFAAGELERRFSDGALGGIRIPLPDFDTPDLAPATILVNWLVALQNELAETPPATATASPAAAATP